MKKFCLRFLLFGALALGSSVALATFHTFIIEEIYSDASGSVQYVVLREASNEDGQNLFATHGIKTVTGTTQKGIKFTEDLPNSQTSGKYVLIGTQSFAALGVVVPDYVVPDGFIPLTNGVVDFAGVDAFDYVTLPTDGVNALYRDGTAKPNLATNFAGATGSAVPGAAGPPTVAVIEYHHASFDHYFITPVAAEIALLDARQPPFQDWSRTGFSFKAYVNATAPAGSVAICRFFNDHFAPKSSHFYAAHGFGCEATIAQFPDWGLEDDKLFNMMLPDASGACPVGTIPVYRLYNAGMGAAPNHRFVTNFAERQKMIDQHFIAEGNGLGVGMCAPG